MDNWIAASLHLSDGRVIRFGPDESDLGDVPTAISFSTTNPGGFASASLTLPRPANLFADDSKLFSHVELYGPGHTIYYEGIIIGVPQVARDSIQLQLSGWVTVLDRIQTFREIFVDRDLSAWGGASTDRRVSLLGGFSISLTGSTRIEPDEDSSPRLVMFAPAGDVYSGIETWYDAGAGNGIESVVFYWSCYADNNFGFYCASDSNDTDTAGDGGSTGDLCVGTTFSGTTSLSAGSVRYAYFGWYYAAAAPWGNDGQDYSVTVSDLAVFGNHGLTKRGTAPDQGFFASDVVAYAIQQAADLSVGEIEQTSFVIPHLTFKQDTSLRSVIEQLTALGGNQNLANDWGVYEDREFYWRSPGTYGREWHVRRDDVAVSSSDGPDADRRVAGVKVNYTDPAGTAMSIGPPGSNADTETAALLASDPDNPAHRIQGAFASESVGVTSEAGAQNIGVMILNERNRLDWRGSIEVTGEALDSTGNRYSSALIRAGDRIVVDDAPDTSARTIVGTSYSHDSMTTSCEIGAMPDSLDAMLGQLALVTDLVG